MNKKNNDDSNDSDNDDSNDSDNDGDNDSDNDGDKTITYNSNNISYRIHHPDCHPPYTNFTNFGLKVCLPNIKREGIYNMATDLIYPVKPNVNIEEHDYYKPVPKETDKVCKYYTLDKNNKLYICSSQVLNAMKRIKQLDFFVKLKTRLNNTNFVFSQHKKDVNHDFL